MKFVDVMPDDISQSFREDVVSLINKYSKNHNLTMEQMLALSATVVGYLIAQQDMRSMTAKMAQDIVVRNIEVGNADAIAFIAKTEGSA